MKNYKMNKKGQIAFVGGLITLTVMVLLVAYLFIPQAKTMSQTSFYTDLLNEHFNGTGTTTTQLENYNTIITNSLSISGLTLTSNYTVNYDLGLVIINNATTSGNYTANYEYEGSSYLSNSGQRSLSTVLILAGIIGLLIIVFRLFNIA